MNEIVTALKRHLMATIDVKTKLANDAGLQETFARAVLLIVERYRMGGRLYIAGNGGSAADAQHLAAEFVSKLAKPRAPLPAEALSVDTSILTAIGNDYGFEKVFSRQLEAKLTTHDLFLAITTSGQSPNILEALAVCKAREIPTILLTGRDGGRAKALSDLCLIVPSEDTAVIQEAHQALYHCLCGAIENALFPD